MSNLTQTARINPTLLNQEATQQSVLEKLCDQGQSENGWLEGVQTTAETGVDATILTSTAVGAGLSRWISRINVACTRAGKYTILDGASIIGSGRLVEGQLESAFVWDSGYKMTTGDQVTVKFEQYRGTNADIEVYAQGIEK